MRQIFGIFLPTMIAETIFDENNTTDTNIEHDNAVTVVGDGTDNVEYEDASFEDKDSSVVQKAKAPVALAEVDFATTELNAAPNFY